MLSTLVIAFVVLLLVLPGIVANKVAEAGQKSDMQTQALANGKANVVDVVTAVAETEVAVETLVSWAGGEALRVPMPMRRIIAIK